MVKNVISYEAFISCLTVAETCLYCIQTQQKQLYDIQDGLLVFYVECSRFLHNLLSNNLVVQCSNFTIKNFIRKNDFHYVGTLPFQIIKKNQTLNLIQQKTKSVLRIIFCIYCLTTLTVQIIR